MNLALKPCSQESRPLKTDDSPEIKKGLVVFPKTPYFMEPLKGLEPSTC